MSVVALFTALRRLSEACETNSKTRQVRTLYPDERLCFKVKRFPVS